MKHYFKKPTSETNMFVICISISINIFDTKFIKGLTQNIFHFILL